MTRQRVYGVDSEFNAWIRDNAPDSRDGYYYADIDGNWFSFQWPAWMILIESKMKYGRWPNDYQMEDLAVKAQMLARGATGKFKTIRGERPVEFRGLFVITGTESLVDVESLDKRIVALEEELATTKRRREQASLCLFKNACLIVRRYSGNNGLQHDEEKQVNAEGILKILQTGTL